MTATAISIRKYERADQPHFESLNRMWIEQWFEMEPADFDMLGDPETALLNNGGHIFIAVADNNVVGTVALKRKSSECYELTKMAVHPDYRKHGAGLALATAALEQARKDGMQNVILYSNRKLVPAIALYEKLGFREVPFDASYKRTDIKMKIDL